MKIETLVFDNLKKVLPKEATKTILYAFVEDTSYELYFYCVMGDGKLHQCYSLAENGILDSYTLDQTFAMIASQIKSDKKYKVGSNNIFTFVIDNCGVQLDVNYYEKGSKVFKIKKQWSEKYLY